MPRPGQQKAQRERHAKARLIPPTPDTTAATEPDITRKRRRLAGMAGNLAQGVAVTIRPEHGFDIADMSSLLTRSGGIVKQNQGVTKLELSRDYAKRASPRIILLMLRISGDKQQATKDRIAAARVVLDVAGALNPQTDNNQSNQDVRDMSRDEIQRLIMQARTAEAELSGDGAAQLPHRANGHDAIVNSQPVDSKAIQQ